MLERYVENNRITIWCSSPVPFTSRLSLKKFLQRSSSEISPRSKSGQAVGSLSLSNSGSFIPKNSGISVQKGSHTRVSYRKIQSQYRRHHVAIYLGWSKVICFGCAVASATCRSSCTQCPAIIRHVCARNIGGEGNPTMTSKSSTDFPADSAVAEHLLQGQMLFFIFRAYALPLFL